MTGTMVTQSEGSGGELNVDQFVLWDYHHARECLRLEATKIQKQKQSIYVDETEQWLSEATLRYKCEVKSLTSWSFLCSGKRQIINKNDFSKYKVSNPSILYPLPMVLKASSVIY